MTNIFQGQTVRETFKVLDTTFRENFKPFKDYNLEIARFTQVIRAENNDEKTLYAPRGSKEFTAFRNKVLATAERLTARKAQIVAIRRLAINAINHIAKHKDVLTKQVMSRIKLLDPKDAEHIEELQKEALDLLVVSIKYERNLKGTLDITKRLLKDLKKEVIQLESTYQGDSILSKYVRKLFGHLPITTSIPSLRDPELTLPKEGKPQVIVPTLSTLETPTQQTQLPSAPLDLEASSEKSLVPSTLSNPVVIDINPEHGFVPSVFDQKPSITIEEIDGVNDMQVVPYSQPQPSAPPIEHFLEAPQHMMSLPKHLLNDEFRLASAPALPLTSGEAHTLPTYDQAMLALPSTENRDDLPTYEQAMLALPSSQPEEELPTYEQAMLALPSTENRDDLLENNLSKNPAFMKAIRGESQNSLPAFKPSELQIAQAKPESQKPAMLALPSTENRDDLLPRPSDLAIVPFKQSKQQPSLPPLPVIRKPLPLPSAPPMDHAPLALPSTQATTPSLPSPLSLVMPSTKMPALQAAEEKEASLTPLLRRSKRVSKRKDKDTSDKENVSAQKLKQPTTETKNPTRKKRKQRAPTRAAATSESETEERRYNLRSRRNAIRV